MTQKQKLDFVKKLTRHVIAIAKERDALRETVEEYSEICDDADKTCQELWHAIETLSQRL
jgi:hypothetical protein